MSGCCRVFYGIRRLWAEIQGEVTILTAPRQLVAFSRDNHGNVQRRSEDRGSFIDPAWSQSYLEF
jgi:hypothetical protein